MKITDVINEYQLPQQKDPNGRKFSKKKDTSHHPIHDKMVSEGPPPKENTISRDDVWNYLEGKPSNLSQEQFEKSDPFKLLTDREKELALAFWPKLNGGNRVKKAALGRQYNRSGDAINMALVKGAVKMTQRINTSIRDLTYGKVFGEDSYDVVAGKDLN